MVGTLPGGGRTGVPRVGLVLGAGGLVGGAFHAGVLAALAEATGWDPRQASLVVGTSAGSVSATALRAGLSAADILARVQGRPLSAEGTRLLERVAPNAHHPPPLRLRPGRRRSAAEIAALLAAAARRPLATRPTAMLASLVPAGSVPTDFITAGIGALTDDDWPDGDLWICSVRQRDGRRVVFGRDGRPPIPLAVAASCAIPGVFQPVVIDGDTYVDGGAHSPTNADLAGDAGLDLVLVSSPMSSAGRSVRFSPDQLVRRWSRALLDTEAATLRRRGVHVMAFQPTPDDLAVMGLNAMDAGRQGPVARQARESTLRRLARHDSMQRLAALVAAA